MPRLGALKPAPPAPVGGCLGHPSARPVGHPNLHRCARGRTPTGSGGGRSDTRSHQWLRVSLDLESAGFAADEAARFVSGHRYDVRSSASLHRSTTSVGRQRARVVARSASRGQHCVGPLPLTPRQPAQQAPQPATPGRTAIGAPARRPRSRRRCGASRAVRRIPSGTGPKTSAIARSGAGQNEQKPLDPNRRSALQVLQPRRPGVRSGRIDP